MTPLELARNEDKERRVKMIWRRGFLIGWAAAWVSALALHVIGILK